MEYLFLDFLNRQTGGEVFKDTDEHTLHEAHLFAGAIFNVYMAWLDGGCAEPLGGVTRILSEPINISNQK